MFSKSFLILLRSVSLTALLAGCAEDQIVASDAEPRESFNEWHAPACDFGAPPIRAAATGLCVKNGWCWENPLPFGANLRIASAPGAAETWVISEHGLHRLEGGRWVSVDVAVDVFYDAAVLAPNDIWLSGTRERTGPVLLHFDGLTWSEHQVPGEEYFTLRSSGNTVWLVTQMASHPHDIHLKRFRTGTWERIETTAEAALALDNRGPFGTALVNGRWLFPVGDDELWMVGDRIEEWADPRVYHDELYRYANGQWTRIEHDLKAVSMVWGTASNDVWLGGHGKHWVADPQHDLPLSELNQPGGALRHWDGNALSPVALPEVAEISAIGGTSRNDVWIGTEDGELLHYDGKQATLDPSLTATRAITSFSIQNGTDIWAALSEKSYLTKYDSGGNAGGLIHFDGQRWTDASVVPTVQHIKDLWGSSLSDTWAVGSNGLKLHFDGEEWSNGSEGTQNFTGIWGSARDNVWAVTEEGSIEHYDGSKWKVVYSSKERFTDVWGTGPSSLWLLTRTGLARFDGRTFHNVEKYVGANDYIWASSDKDVWMVGHSRIRRYDGDVVHRVGFPGAQGLLSIWGRNSKDVLVAAPDGVFRFDGAEWTHLIASESKEWDFKPHALGGCGDQHFWMTDANSVKVFDGTNWTTSFVGGPHLQAVWGTSPDHLVVGGLRGSLVRRNP